MGFMSWLVKGSGFENDNSYSPEDRQKAKLEKRKLKESKKHKGTSSGYNSQPQVPPQNSYLSNPEQYNTVNYESSMNDYGLGSSNVGGYGSKNVEFVSPTRFEDVKLVIKFLKNGDAVMLNLNQMGQDSQRVIDIISGATAALNGNIKRVDSNIFLVTPEGFNIRISDNTYGNQP